MECPVDKLLQDFLAGARHALWPPPLKRCACCAADCGQRATYCLLFACYNHKEQQIIVFLQGFQVPQWQGSHRKFIQEVERVMLDEGYQAPSSYLAVVFSVHTLETLLGLYTDRT